MKKQQNNTLSEGKGEEREVKKEADQVREVRIGFVITNKEGNYTPPLPELESTLGTYFTLLYGRTSIDQRWLGEWFAEDTTRRALAEAAIILTAAAISATEDIFNRWPNSDHHGHDGIRPVWHKDNLNQEQLRDMDARQVAECYLRETAMMVLRGRPPSPAVAP